MIPDWLQMTAGFAAVLLIVWTAAEIGRERGRREGAAAERRRIERAAEARRRAAGRRR